MKRLVLLAVLSFSCVAATEQKIDKDGIETVQNLMLTSKWAGMCGAIKQMATFQESTKMPGGDEFLTRFLTTEQARLGMSPQEFLDSCQKSISTYTTYYNMKPDKN
ncbi:hypothetical protein FP371_21335 [Citrobacter freundii]|uniref:hypothetical protein n=1 Tax=Citrobacter freundii TaxID=546 RepID=UPI001BCC7473|nr:hypothetical protein [Citrobacter freundii]MBY5300761.1 hypothetical protein [Citrobacter freundii]